MTWYYAQGDQQLGPVSEADFENLVRSGIIHSETRVWHEGMADWQPYSYVTGTGTQTTVPPAGSVVCAECKKIFPASETIRFGEAHVCAACKPYYVQRLKEGATMAGGYDYAGFGIRLAAKILDTLIMYAVFFVVGLVIGLMGRAGGAMSYFQLVLTGAFSLAAFGYQIFFLGRYGATPGKMICKIKVIRADGEKLGYGRATGRVFAEILSGMICYIGYLMVLGDAEKRALHDRICNTRVIKVSSQ
ncbi:MAG: RDD family protein [Verrucomicrobiota bacterium]